MYLYWDEVIKILIGHLKYYFKLDFNHQTVPEVTVFYRSEHVYFI